MNVYCIDRKTDNMKILDFGIYVLSMNVVIMIHKVDCYFAIMGH